MTIPFLKLQIGGNGFILVDLAQASELQSDQYGPIAKSLCDRRFGPGATGVIYLSRDNTIRIHTPKGLSVSDADDAYLCAARFAFDSGRVSNRMITFKTPAGEKAIDVLGSREFRLSCGSPFSLVSGQILEPGSSNCTEIVEHEGIRTAFTALHIHEDVVIAFPQSLGTLDYAGLSSLVVKAFPGKQVLPVIARALTRDSILVRANPKRESSVCAAAAATLAAAVSSGQADSEAIVILDTATSDGQPDTVLARDKDNTRRIAAAWDQAANEISVIGTGGYVYEGKYDLSEDA
jgi:diaminopimelate epimerase